MIIMIKAELMIIVSNLGLVSKKIKHHLLEKELMPPIIGYT